MPSQKRIKTRYPGVYYIEGNSATGKPERIYYIRYRRNGRQIDEKTGRQFQDDMTPARAARIRGERIEGQPSNADRRDAAKAKKRVWTIDRLWDERVKQKTLKGFAQGKLREFVTDDIEVMVES